MELKDRGGWVKIPLELFFIVCIVVYKCKKNEYL